jgi:acyl-CoA synthetase (AMP-forming)/AMP-acid ligase II
VDLLPSRLATVAQRFGDRVALHVADGESMTYGQWDRRASAVARGLARAGVARGERVALLVANEAAPIYAAGYFAVLRAGAVAVPMNPRLARRELEHLIADSGATAIVAGPAEADRARALAARDGRDLLVIAPGARGGGELDWEDLASGDPAPFQVEVGPDDLADVLYTSGTTGRAKGVAATHRSAMVAHPLSPIEGGGTLLHSIPLATFMGTHGTQSLCLRLALTNLLLATFDPARFAELVALERPGWTIMVPAHALLLLEAGVLDWVDTSCVRMVIYGSAPMPHHAVEGLAKAFPRAALLNGYGLTEGGTSVVAMPPGEAVRRPGSVGRPLDPEGIKVVDDQGEPVPAHAVGEVAIKVLLGQRYYLNDPDASAATWRGEWVHSGDLGYLDDDGYLYLVDRKKDLIVRGGYNISSIEVESALHEHPDVLEAAVLGVAHPVLGQDVAAVVRLRPGASLSLESTKEFLLDRLADYKRPRQLVVQTEPLPRTAMGKLDKAGLRARFADPPTPSDHR